MEKSAVYKVKSNEPDSNLVERTSGLVICVYIQVNVFNYLLLLTCSPMFLAAPMPRTPFWKNPCGMAPAPSDSDLDSDLSEQVSMTWQQQVRSSLYTVGEALQNCRNTMIHLHFNKLYKDVKRGVTDDQYIPNWLPSRESALELLPRDRTRYYSAVQVAQRLPRLLQDLQKFAVALEQVFVDEDNTYPHTVKVPALSRLIGQHKQMLCEVESSMWSLDLQPLAGVTRDIMLPGERSISDFTHRLIRDNGVLVKYRDYLDVWAQALGLALAS